MRYLPTRHGAAILFSIALGATSAFAQCTTNGNPSPCTLTGPETDTSYSAGNSTTTTSSGVITNNGPITFTSGANNTILNLSDNTTLQGGGTVSMVETGGGRVYFQQGSGGLTLTNADNTIQGSGVIGNGGLAFINNGGGTLNANANGLGLVVNGSGGVTNQGLLTATNGGILTLQSVTVGNSGGNITANGGVVQIDNSVINGGTLNSTNGGTLQTVANGISTLNGVTLSAGSTYSSGNNTYLYLGGTTTNNGSIQLTAAANNTIGWVASNVTLTGGGTVNMSSTGAGGTSYIQQASGGLTLANVNNTIQGTGVIGNGGLAFLNDAGGTVNANVSGQVLSLNGSGNVVNRGLLTATGGGILDFTSTTVDNTGSHITANGGGVQFNSSVINGGTLSAINGGTLQTVANGISTLNGVTLSAGSTYSSGNNTYLFLSGTTTNNGNIHLSADGNNTIAWLTTNVTLTGGGTVNLSSTGAGGTPIIQQASGGLTLENVNNTIQGTGIIGNGGLAFLNDAGGTVNANTTGQALVVNGTGPQTNLGLLTATNGGILEITGTTINNQNGNITGNGGTVVVSAATLQGGTLNGTLQTAANGTVTLDGTTNGAITFSAGTAYTSGNNTQLNTNGTLNNNGSINVSAAGNNTFIVLSNNTTLTGNGNLTLATSGGGSVFVEQASGGLTLTNNGNTIQGAGVIGNGGLTVVNGTTGTLLANAAGQALTLNGTGGLTNNGTMQANAGSTLHSTAGFTNYASNTLTGGTYNVFGTAANAGTIQVDSLGTGGGEIHTNAATVRLSGPNSNFVDQSGSDAFSAFSDNSAAGSFTIDSGRDFTSADPFSNEGILKIGVGSTFFVGSTSSGIFTQTAGTSTVDGTLDPQSIDIFGGLTNGTGLLDGNVDVETTGRVSPGDAGSAGALSVSGTYTQGAAGELDIAIGSAAPGIGYSVLDVIGAATLDGTLDLTSLGGFNPFAGETFFVLNASSVTGQFSASSWANLTAGLTYVLQYNSTNVEVIVNGAVVTSPTPEPGTLILLVGAVGVLALCRRNRRRS